MPSPFGCTCNANVNQYDGLGQARPGERYRQLKAAKSARKERDRERQMEDTILNTEMERLEREREKERVR